MPETNETSASPYGGRGPLCMGITWTEAAVALVLITLRAKTASFYPERRSSLGVFGFRWDFIWALVTVLIALAAQTLMTISATHGLGNHEGLLSDDGIVATNFWSWVGQVVAILALSSGRMAVIAFLIDVQTNTNMKGRWVLYMIGVLQVAINVAEVILILYQCTPIKKLWNSKVQGICSLVVLCSQLGFLQGSIGVLADVVLAFYPIYLIGPLQHMKMSLKIGLCLILSGGIIAGIAGINKTIAIATITQNDITYAIAKLNTWVLTEMWFIIIFGSIPALRPFFMRFSQQLRGTSGRVGSSGACDARFAVVSQQSAREQPGQTPENEGSLAKSWNEEDRDDVWLQLDDRACEYSAHSLGPRLPFDKSSQDNASVHTPSVEHSEGRSDGIVITKETTVTRQSRYYGGVL